MHPQPTSTHNSSNPNISRYIVQSTDVLQDMRVNVFEEGSPDRVIWFKERFLGDNEIIEQVVHNHTQRVCWIIHRPFRGWYIRLRTPMFPPGVFIPLTPLPLESPYYVESALSFASRTNPTPFPIVNANPMIQRQPRSLTLQEDDGSQSSIHSYPPTPPTITIRPPNITGTSTGIGTTNNVNPSPQSQITTFVLSPSATPPVPHTSTSTEQSFFSRAISMLKTQRVNHSNSFSISRVPLNTPLSPPPPYALNLPPASDISLGSTVALTTPTPSTTTAASAQVASTTSLAPSLHAPLLTFHDQTPVYTVRSLTGLLEINKAEEVLLGVDTSFWIAIALTYLEFLEERDSYLAAVND